MSTARSKGFTPTKPKDAAAWGGKKYHNVVLPSGAEVTIIVPNLPALVKTGQVPNDLIESAVGVMQGTVEITAELLAEQADFYTKLVALTVSEPAITESDVADLPYEDVEMLAEIATRQRDVDALGRHLAGLHTSKEWRTFRGLDLGGSALESL